MPSPARIAAILNRAKFDQARHLVWLDRRGLLDSCLADSPRASAILDRYPAGWRIVGFIDQGHDLPTFATIVRAAAL